MAPDTPAQVAARVRRADKSFGRVVSKFGPPPMPRAKPVAARFGTLAQAILYQQLAGAAAAAIHGRVLATCGDPLTARGLVGAGDAALAACGVSGPKRRSLFDLVEKTEDGTIDFRALGRRTDDEVTEILTTVQGIGPWTAQMFCLSTLGRRDVWPSSDYGVRLGWTLLHGAGELVSARELHELGEPFRPHRSAVAWYCWRAIEDDRSTRKAD